MNIQTIQKSQAEAALARQFDAESATPNQRAAFERFATLGLPTRRVESWHYTDLRAAMTDAAPPAGVPDAAALDLASALLAGRRRLGAVRLVLVNGGYAKDLSDPPPFRVTVEREPSWPARADDAMTALNEAMTGEACRLDIADGQALEEPIEIVHVTAGGRPLAIYSRMVLVAGAGSRASIVESFVGASSATQRNAATSLVLGKGSRIKRVVAIDDEPGLHVESLVGRLAKNAAMEDFALVSGGALTRRQLFLDLAGEGATLALAGLTLVDGSRRADTTLRVTHSAPGGTSREFYRTIIDDDGVGTFQGKIIVAKAAQKTDGAMKSQAVLLSPSAQMNAKPELEIFADDVVCGHGATVASLDPEQLFYLEARGIPGPEAEAMLLEAFGEEAIARVKSEALAETLRAQFRGWLHSGQRGGTRPDEARR